MNLSPHFDREEFERDGDFLPLETIQCFTELCKEILEPMREKFGEPFYITSGYRSLYRNRSMGSGDDSQHIATAHHCAVDGYFVSLVKNMRPVFDWFRTSNLPFDQCILEHGKYGQIVHLSYTRTPRRVALEGQTFNQGGYKSWPVAPISISA